MIVVWKAVRRSSVLLYYQDVYGNRKDEMSPCENFYPRRINHFLRRSLRDTENRGRHTIFIMNSLSHSSIRMR